MMYENAVDNDEVEDDDDDADDDDNHLIYSGQIYLTKIIMIET